jgi:Ca2+-binding EF-hand superfamily protein
MILLFVFVFCFKFVIDELQGNLTEETLRHVLNELGIRLSDNQILGLWKSVTQNNTKDDVMLSA